MPISSIERRFCCCSGVGCLCCVFAERNWPLVKPEISCPTDFFEGSFNPSSWESLRNFSLVTSHWNPSNRINSSERHAKEQTLWWNKTGRDRMRSKYFNNLALSGPRHTRKRSRQVIFVLNIGRFADICERRNSSCWEMQHRDKYRVRYFETESKGYRELAKLKSRAFQKNCSKHCSDVHRNYNIEIWYFSVSLFLLVDFLRSEMRAQGKTPEERRKPMNMPARL